MTHLYLKIDHQKNLKELDSFFADTSGLNINFAKTKMVVNSHKITYHSKITLSNLSKEL